MARKTKQADENTPGSVQTQAVGSRIGELQSESEKKYHALFSEMVSGSALHELVYDNTGTPVDYITLEVNKAYERLLQVDKSTVIGCKASAVLPQDELKKWLGIFAPVALTGKSNHYEMYSPFNDKYFEGTVYCPETGKFAVTFSDVSERKHAEEKLRESQVRERDRANELEAILDSVPALVWLAHDPECKLVTGNRAASEFLRMPQDANQSLTAPTGEVAIHFKVYQDGKEIPLLDLPVNRAARGIEIKNFEEQVVFDDGSRHYLVGNAVPLFDDHGKPRGAVAAFRDITPRKQAEMKLDQTTQRYRELFENSGTGTVIVDEHGRYLMVNKKAAAGLGKTPDGVLGKSMVDFLPQETASRYLELHRQLLQTGGNLEYEDTLLLPTGMRSFIIVDQCLKDENGKCFAIQSSSIDITERKQAETRLEESEAKLRALFDRAGYAMGLAKAGTQIMVNQAYLDLFGYNNLSEVIGNPLYEDIAPEERPRLQAYARRRSQGESAPSFYETRGIRRDGTCFDMDVRISTYEFMREIYTIGIMSDITERKQAEGSLHDLLRRHEALLAAMPEIVMEVDNQKVYTWANQAGFEFFGADVIGKEAAFYFEGEQETYQTIKPLFNGNEQTFYVESWQRRKDGQKRLLAWWCRALKDDNGNVTGALSSARDLTQRKRAEDDLRESQKQYRLLAENVSDVIWVISMETEHFTYVSPSVYNLLGYRPDEILDQSMENILAPDSFAYLNSVLSARLIEFSQNKSQVYVDAIQHNKKDGTTVWAEATMRFVKNEDSGQIEIYGVSRDITERKRSREMLEKRVAQLQLLNDVGSQLTAELDVKRVLDLAVFLVQEMFNYYHVGLFTTSEEGDELILRSKAGALVNLIPGQHRLQIGQGIVGWVSTHGKTLLCNDVRSEPRYVNLYPHLVKTQSELSIPIRINNQILGVLDIQSPDRDVFDDNDVLAMETLANQIAVALENARLYQAAQQELIERKRVEMMLRERVERLRNLHEIDQAILAVQSLQEIAGIFLSDVHRLIECDHASIVLFGEENAYTLDPGDKINVFNVENQALDPVWAARLKTWKEIIIDDLLVQPFEHPFPELEAIQRRGFRSILSIPLIVQEDLIGIINLASVQPSAFVHSHSEIVREMTVQIAIAIRQTQMYEQIQHHAAVLEQRVAERTEELHQANVALTRASRMKDEFLASMSHELRTPLTGVLNLSEALQEQVYGTLNEKQLKSLHMIEESGRHLLGLINDILDLSKIEAGQFELQIDTCSVASVCQSSLQIIKGMAQKKRQSVSFAINPPSIDMQADPRRLKQMLVNLLSNAVKFTPEEGAIGLQVEGDTEAQVVRFLVWDEGIGIAVEDLPKLFLPFTQLDSSLSRQQSGTGLGLALVQHMADLHGGSVRVESDLGKGSRFMITLPLKQMERSAPPFVEQRGSALPLSEVLTVEDMGMDAAHLTRLLTEMGIKNIVHSYGDGVVDLAAQSRPGAVLLDIYLPDKLGWEVLASLKADSRTSDLPVIITSIEEDRARAAVLGAAGYLVKPFTLASLRAELEHATNQVFLHQVPVIVVGKPSTVPLILLAEDNEDTIGVYSDYLLSKNYRVAVARHGSDAITLLQELHPNLILMDIQMPGMDGLEAIRHIRASMDTLVAATPIIALTALAMPGDRERCLAVGANEYLSKPVSLQDLIRVIQSHMNISEPAHQ